MGIMDLFVKKEDGTAAPAPADATPATTPAPARTSRAGSAAKGKATAAPEEEEVAAEDTSATDGGVDKKILANLEQALTDATPKDYGYLQFRGSLAKMEKKIPNEGSRFTAALTAAEAMGADSTKIVATAQAALTVLAGEQKQFNAEITELQKADAAKQAKVTSIEEQIHTLQQQQTKLNKELAASAAEIQASQQNFAVTYKSLVAEIKSDIEKVNEYSTTTSK